MSTLSSLRRVHRARARLDRRTKHLVKRLTAGRHRDHRPHRPRPRLGRGARRVGRPRGRQRRAVPERPLPEPGPAPARPRRRPADRRARRRPLRRLDDGELLTVRGGSLFRNGTCLATGRVLEAARARGALAEQREPRDRGARGVRRQHDALPPRGRAAPHRGSRLPGARTRFRDRHALVVARGPGYKRDLRIVRPYIRDFKPVLIAVDGGADALLEAGYKPDVIVGDMDSVSDDAAPLGRRARRPRLPGRRGSGRGAARPARAAAPGRLGPGDQRGHRAPARLREGRRADRRRRHALQPDRVPGAQPRRDVVDVRDAAQGGGDPHRREGRLAARSRRVGVWPLVAFTAAGLAAIAVAVLVSPDLRELIDLLATRLQELLGLG